ncbi:polysaccharide deacetylase family protein [Peterkaempfera bronchialis]|uniref:Polysaccharide deacetylase family protein n=1 Tax=Peterkaempfera bronchialis TaxID=2126346 RepID=A0A345T4A0_9ACTN|nr:polysaccharide deacetylase family protein [Peterkaempfera bronchialis]AXI80805.1 polysaccharide deacetylase family protein [Peterkaempfera bronchialis]
MAARARTPLLLATALPVLAAAGHLGPAGSWLPPVRRTLLPALAGLGRPDHVALTFDDGPDPRSTPHILAALDRLGLRATFFVLGEAVRAHPALCASIARQGHELALHGWTHTRPWLPAPLRDRRELARAAEAVREAAGAECRWYRPPYGVLTGGRWAAARHAGLRPVLWSAWGRDWTADATPASVLATVARDLRGGGTVLLHDSDRTSAPGSWRTTLEALPLLAAFCRRRGWQPGPLAEHGTGGIGTAEGAPGV